MNALSNKAAWRMFGITPRLCDAEICAAAILYAAENNWLHENLSDALDGNDPAANNKLKARRAFHRLLDQPPDEAAKIQQVFAALAAVPQRWRNYSRAEAFAFNVKRTLSQTKGDKS